MSTNKNIPEGLPERWHAYYEFCHDNNYATEVSVLNELADLRKKWKTVFGTDPNPDEPYDLPCMIREEGFHYQCPHLQKGTKD